MMFRWRWATAMLAIGFALLACSSGDENADQDEDDSAQTEEQELKSNGNCVRGGYYCGGAPKLGGKGYRNYLYRCTGNGSAARAMYCGSAGCYRWPAGYNDACYPPS